MNPKLTHLQSLADSAHADLTHVAEQIRDARDQFHAVDRHRQNMEDKGFALSAPDEAKHAELQQRIEFLTDKHGKLRLDHRNKRQLLDRCTREANHA